MQRKRTDNSASNFNIISKIAMTLLDKEKSRKFSLAKKEYLPHGMMTTEKLS